MQTRFQWDYLHVVDTNPADFLIRTRIEHEAVRKYLDDLTQNGKFKTALDVGCGFGRMSLLLQEYTESLIGVEREIAFVEKARELVPRANFVNVETLEAIPFTEPTFDFILTFTVLQHLTDAVAKNVIDRLIKIINPGGHILICEESNPTFRWGDVENPMGMCTIGRTVETYQELFQPLKLIHSSKREIESSYERKDVGIYLLFQNE